MARRVRDQNLETRTARARLGARSKPYWRSIAPGMHVGYRRSSRGGVWLARLYVEGQYREQRIGVADDMLDGDGVASLSFAQAQARAGAWFADAARVAAGLEPKSKGPYTVADALAAYLTDYVARGGKALHETETKIGVHILPALGPRAAASLSTKQIRDWHHGLATAPARVRTGIGEAQAHRKIDDSAEGKRKRRSTANRILALLKAALSHAKRDKLVASDDAWRDVKPFKGASAPIIRYLTEAECARLVNSTDEEFRPLVRAALFTGCRWSELLALRVADLNVDAGTLAIHSSKGGKPRHVVLADEARSFFAAATAGRLSGAPIFARADGTPWHRNAQQSRMAEACQRAKIVPAVSFHILRHTHASLLAMRGVALPIIGAQLGHAPGSAMTSKHYAHLSPSHIAEQIRAHFPTLGIGGSSNVMPLRPKRLAEAP